MPYSTVKTAKNNLLKILVCPSCKGELAYDQSQQTLSCRFHGYRFKIINHIPILKISEAEKFNI